MGSWQLGSWLDGEQVTNGGSPCHPNPFALSSNVVPHFCLRLADGEEVGGEALVVVS